MKTGKSFFTTAGLSLVAYAGSVTGCDEIAPTDDPSPTEAVSVHCSTAALTSMPTGKGGDTLLDHQASSGLTPSATMGNGIDYHGGPVMPGSTNIYYIWYGNWSGNMATAILTDWANNIGGSPYFNINTTYSDGSGTPVSNSVHYAGSTTDSYSQGNSLSDAQIQSVVSSAITTGRLPRDTNAAYFVLTSADVTASSGFCTAYCGWHSHGTISGSDIKYSFVGDPTRCPSNCQNQSTGPNGSTGADGMASVIAHELEETVTDPDLNAWYDSGGAENADKCAWNFGSTYTAPNGSKANIQLGNRDYLIQQNWVNTSGGYCALQYGAPQDWLIGDVNADRETDLVTVTSNPGQVTSWRSHGDGTYDLISYRTASDTALQNGNGLVAADVDGDGKTDLVHITTNPGVVVSWLSNGNGTYNPVGYTSLSDTCLIGCGTWQFGDVNGDRRTDLIHITTNPGEVITWLSNGNGTYNSVSYTTTVDTALQNGNGLVAADVNGDGKTDLVHITTNPGVVVSWLSNGDGTYNPVGYTSASDTCLTGCGPWQFGDVNGDRRTDLIHITTNPGEVITWLSNGNGTYSSVSHTTTVDTALQNGNGLVAADVNGDGKTDLVHITTNPGVVVSWFSNGDGTYNPVGYTSASDTCLTGCGSWRFGDVNGDGKTDLLHLPRPDQVVSWLSTGSGTYNPVWYTTP